MAKILGCSTREAQESVQGFIDSYPGLRHLKEVIIPRDAERGYYTGFDGRIIKCDEYHMLAGYLQTGETLVMKTANINWRQQLLNAEIWFKQVNDVHDEWQTECNDNPADIRSLVHSQCASIRRAGEKFGLNCPLEGTSKVGRNWLTTH